MGKQQAQTSKAMLITRTTRRLDLTEEGRWLFAVQGKSFHLHAGVVDEA
jgi:DNA-binding transcriptional LysR family regulator